jgi:mannose-6-phosphate isomerase
MRPVLADKPWAGGLLAGLGKPLVGGRLVGESWEVADLPPEENRTVPEPWTTVAGGRFDGWTLRRLLARFGRDFLGSAESPGGRFPLLIKLLDAGQHLSIQVHPPVGYVRDHPEARLKTESWYVVTARPGAELFLGVHPGVGSGDVAAAIGTSRMVDLLRRLPAVPGAFHHLPAGLIHALGAGVVVAEVQTPSDTTFRMYDWTEEYGRAPRPLHLTEALAAMNLAPEGAFDLGPMTEAGSRLLVETPFYRVVEHRGTVLPAWTSPELRILMVLEGGMEIGERAVEPGTTCVVPAIAAPTTRLVSGPSLRCLEISLPLSR